MTSSAEPPDSENCDQLWECFPMTSRCVDRIAFSPDGKLIASCNDNSLEHIKLWDVESGKQLFDMNSRLYASDFTLPVSSGEGVYYLFDFFSFMIKSVFFSSDPKDLTCRGSVWDLAVGKVVYVREITSYRKEVTWYTLAVSPDLQLTASAYNSTITLWETSTGIDKHTFYLNEQVRNIYVNQFSPDGKIFASLIWFAGYGGMRSSERSGEEKIKLWQVETGKEICSISLPDVMGETRWASILAFSSDSRILASNCGDFFKRVIVLFEAATGVELCRFQGFGKKNSNNYSGGLDRITSLAFSPDNQLLAIGDSTGVITLWRLSKGWLRPLRARKIRTLISCESCEPVKTLAFSPDGELLASGLGDNNSGITLWNVKNGKKHQTFSGHLVKANKISTANSINRDNLAVSPDGKIVAYIDIAHSMIKLWGTQNVGLLGRFEICGDIVSKIVFSQNSKFIIGVQDRFSNFNHVFPQNIITWEVATGKKVKSIDYLSQGDWDSTSVNQYGDLLAIIDPVTLSIKVLEVHTGQTLCTLRSGYEHVWQIIFSPDKRLLATQHSMSEFAIWEITTGRLIRTIHNENLEDYMYLGGPDPVLFSPDGELLAIAATRNITLWQVSSGEKIHTIDRVHRAWGRCMAFSPNGQTLAFTITDEAPLRLWNLETGNETCLIDQSDYTVSSLDFSLNGQVLVSIAAARLVRTLYQEHLP
ncbi:MAG: WD40 repeat domain-containing protein [Nostoc sp.]|uniref:WD40 repeat domain-containing protein n=1 Tax=Nostoc sp. TaxID=1180 RepID=UPI002FF7FCD4